MNDTGTPTVPRYIRRVMPNACEADIEQATATFDEYMAAIWEIVDRLCRERENDSRTLPKRDSVDGVPHPL